MNIAKLKRTPCCNQVEMKKRAWSVDEDQKLIICIERHGTGNWRTLAQKAGLQRSGKSCRLRWFNYLRPDIKRGHFSEKEKQTIITLRAVLGNRWSSIAKHLPMRTDNEIKNYWNSYLKENQSDIKGVDPLCPKRISTTSSSSYSEAITNTKSNTKQGSSKSQTSQLLNKVARKINAWSGYLEAANTLQSVAGNKSNNDNNATKCALESKRDNIIIRQPPVPNDVNFISTHSSTSAQLLNKMATSLSQKVHGHVAAREMFSKLLEGGESSVSGNDDHAGGCLDALNLFEDGKITRIIDSPFSPTQIFNEVTRTSCFSDNWQSVSSNYTSFGNCAASASDSSVSEVNMVNGGRFCIESPNYSSSCFLDENATTASAANESDDYLSEILTRDDEISMQLHQYL